MVSRSVRVLGIELEQAALRAAQGTYDDLNANLFRRCLKPPILAFSEASGRLGQWCMDSRRLELSRRLLVDHGWGVLVEVLKHEMAHQYVAEVLQRGDEGPHGETFRRVCEERGIDPAQAGIPGSEVELPETGRILERIAKLFRLAERGEPNEATAAMGAAQRLMLKYNLTHSRPPTYSFRHLGDATGRVSEVDRILAAILDEHFFVAVIWVPVWRPLEAKRGHVMEVCGTPENLEIASYVYGFLREAAERSWCSYKKANGLRGNAQRREYLAGVLTGFREKLAREKRQHKQEGLVWVGDAGLAGFFKSRHPRVRWVRGEGRRRPEIWARGREAGQHLELRPGMKGKTKGQRLLLPGR